ncbi:hypothetical protein [Nodularia spumigena]|uniref:hypothetical protein n=1 Tax=Nodularia spumigena TaxID=70799 RepID=UPI002B1F923E|nr:hypothetical protein [Nodularia spumigena]MEA5559309.1 hypothetical protein [Nodularia spumigena CH309]
MFTNVAQDITADQLFLIYKEQRLTDALEFLEKAGYTGDLTLFMLAYIQGGLE